MGTIRFELRKKKLDKQGKAPILLNYQVKGQRKYFNTGKKTFEKTWNLTDQEVIYLDKKAAKQLLPEVDYDLLPSAKEAEAINTFLTGKIAQIKRIEDRYEMDAIVYDSEMVIDKLKGEIDPKTKKAASTNILFDFMDRYIKDHEATRRAGSLSVYKSVKKHLQDYCTDKKKVVTFDTIDYSFFQNFQNFLLTPRRVFVKSKSKKQGAAGTWKIISLNNTTVAKQLSTIKTFLNYARVQGYTVSDKYKDFKIKKETLEVIALTSDEFETLFRYNLKDKKRLAQARDVFCFACATGLRYSDLEQLKREHIKNDEIKLSVKKTKENISIPLTPYSRAILKKYEGMHQPLPVISNQKLNDYVKELCKDAGINEPIEIVRYRGSKREAITYPKHELIGVHTGRKTFATLSLERGMSAEEVMAITGHKDYKSFKRYVNVTEQRKKTVMQRAWGKTLSIKKMKAV